MQLIKTLECLKSQAQNLIATIGIFDGVHLGHQATLQRIVRKANRENRQSIVITFKPHPKKIISTNNAPFLIQTSQQKLEFLEKMGINFVVEIIFDRSLSLLSPTQFFNSFLLGHGITEIHVGSNFRFGNQRKGDYQLLKNLSKSTSIWVYEVKPIHCDDYRISSTRIRKAIRKGDIGAAASMLGRPYEVVGTVVKGTSRGKKLGFPTANLQLHNELSPATGVYITQVTLDSMEMNSVTNIGVRPTLPQKSDSATIPTIESHLLDFNGNLYGNFLKLRFLKYIRPEKKFQSIHKLTSQIKSDIRVGKCFFREIDENKTKTSETYC